MAIRLGPPRFRATPGHVGGVFTVGASSYSYPPGARVEYSDDHRLAFVMIRRQLHVVHEAGEVFGVEAALLTRIRRELFGVT